MPGGVHLLKLLQVTPDGTVPDNIAKVNIIILQLVTSVVDALCCFFLVFIALLLSSLCLFLLLTFLFLFFFKHLQELAKLKEENRTLYEELMELRKKIKVRTS